MNYSKKSIKLHKKFQGKISTKIKTLIKNKEDLSLVYTPGVAGPCEEIFKDKEKAYDLTMKGNTVAIVSDGSAVLGLGNIGAEAGLPVMEGKAVLFKKFGDLNAVPICLNTQKTEEIIQTIKIISPNFAAINLEDISAPRCFEIEEKLQDLGIPVMHDDQHGTAIVVLAGLINSLKVVNKSFSDLKIVINGAGAAGMGILKLLLVKNSKEIIVCDSKGIISRKRKDIENNKYKKRIVELTNVNEEGLLKDALKEADVFIGVSAPNVLKKEWLSLMKRDPIIFAMANPIPEIMPKDAYAGGAKIVATGRSDFPNQINNALAFPGLFNGAVRSRAKKISTKMKIKTAEIIADFIKKPNKNLIVPGILNKKIHQKIAAEIIKIKD